jgi:ribosome recycling factor
MNKNKNSSGKINLNLFNDHAILSTIFKDINKKMDNAITKFSESLLDFQVAKVHIGYIGNLKLITGAGKVSDFATLTLEARTFTIKVEDKSKIQPITKTIEQFRGLTVSQGGDKNTLKVTIPDPTEELRERFIKDMKEHGRQYLDQINNIRRDCISMIEKECKAKEQKKKDKKDSGKDSSSSGISEDEMKTAKTIVEQMKDKNLETINSLMNKWEQDIKKAIK